MEILYELSSKKLRSMNADFVRHLFHEIDWNDRLISIAGSRGTGKTTLMLQHLKKTYTESEALYVSLDHLYFTKNNLVETADRFSKMGGRALYLDEVHKYPNWSMELKNIYDDYPELNIVFSASSMLEIYKGSGDLSRRLSSYHLPSLSFREYIELEYSIAFPRVELEELLKNHTQYSHIVLAKMRPIPAFEKYMQYGSYPFFKESLKKYHERLMHVVHAVLENDLPSITPVEYTQVVKIKFLLKIISEAVPFKPNITKLASLLEMDRKTVLKYLDLLHRSGLITLLRDSTHGDSALSKPQKIYMGSPDLMFALCDYKPSAGTLRETFFCNQMRYKHVLSESKHADFLLDNKITIEVGGVNKGSNQIAGIANSYIAQDNLEHGHGNIIPLWLFGFLY